LLVTVAGFMTGASVLDKHAVMRFGGSHGEPPAEESRAIPSNTKIMDEDMDWPD
jgi:hypothetical protein